MSSNSFLFLLNWFNAEKQKSHVFLNRILNTFSAETFRHNLSNLKRSHIATHNQFSVYTSRSQINTFLRQKINVRIPSGAPKLFCCKGQENK